MPGPSEHHRNPLFGPWGIPATNGSAQSVPRHRSHLRRACNSQPSSGSFPARRLISSAPRCWSRRAGGDRNPWNLIFDNEENGEQ
jgi:hypothetical protein